MYLEPVEGQKVAVMPGQKFLYKNVVNCVAFILK